MNTLAWIKILHLLGMLMWFGTIMLTHGTMARNLSASDPATRKGFALAIGKLNHRYMLPGLLVSLATGIILIVAYYGFAYAYVHAKLTAGVLAAVLSVYAIFHFERMCAHIDTKEPDDPTWRKSFLIWRVLTMSVAALLLFVLISAMLKF